MLVGLSTYRMSASNLASVAPKGAGQFVAKTASKKKFLAPRKINKKSKPAKAAAPVVIKKKPVVAAAIVKATTKSKVAPKAMMRNNGEKKSSTNGEKKSLKAAPVPELAKPEKKKEKSFNNPPVPPAPVMSDSKPKKNQAGITTRELEHFRDLLLAKRRELLGDMSSMEREALRSGGSNLSNLPVHMADQGTDNYEQEFTLGIVEKDRELIREINHALAKVQNGTYGICEGTGKPISKARLEAQPWAKYSIEHARMMEKRRNFANPNW
jgi:DnaK suppressor protein